MNKIQGKEIIFTFSSLPFLSCPIHLAEGWDTGQSDHIWSMSHLARDVVPLKVTLRTVSRMVMVPERD